jgi:hypothetical protein
MKSLLLALLFAAPLAASAQTAMPTPAKTTAVATPIAVVAQMHPQGQIESAATVTDPDFGVHAQVLGLERNVEMLQWRKLDSTAPTHYEQAWVAGRVDATGFDDTHRNPGDIPFNGERWWSADPKLDGQPVSADVLAVLNAWEPLKPDLSQLPTNLAVSFQPDGDWLSTSQDPKHPAIGDVRVRWRLIERATAPMGTVLIAGRWELPAASASAVTTTAAIAQPPSPSGGLGAWMQRAFGDYLMWLIVAGFALGLALLIWKRPR